MRPTLGVHGNDPKEQTALLSGPGSFQPSAVSSSVRRCYLGMAMMLEGRPFVFTVLWDLLSITLL